MAPRAHRWAAAIALALAVQPRPAAAQRLARVEDPLDRPAIPSRRAAQVVLLAVARAGARLVAVGERGIVVVSDDNGRSWRQAVQVPTSVTLTAVHFPTPRRGFAVGHGGIVLRSDDGGERWTRQLDGEAAARLVLAAARARADAAPGDEGARRRLVELDRLLSGGPDKIFLDVWFGDEQRGLAVGTYGLAVRTDDGGNTWQPWVDRLDNPRLLHLIAIRAAGEAVYVAGEQGLFLRSTDGGQTFQRRATPYQGSYSVVVAAPDGRVVLGGLRGNAYWSGDRGETFRKMEVPVPVSLSAGALLADGGIVLANTAGDLLRSGDGGRTVRLAPGPRLPPIAALAQGADGTVIAAGVAGVVRLDDAGAPARAEEQP